MDLFDPTNPLDKRAHRLVAARLSTYAKRGGPEKGPEFFRRVIDRQARARAQAGAARARAAMADLKRRYLN